MDDYPGEDIKQPKEKDDSVIQNIKVPLHNYSHELYYGRFMNEEESKQYVLSLVESLDNVLEYFPSLSSFSSSIYDFVSSGEHHTDKDIVNIFFSLSIERRYDILLKALIFKSQIGPSSSIEYKTNTIIYIYSKKICKVINNKLYRTEILRPIVGIKYVLYDTKTTSYIYYGENNIPYIQSRIYPTLRQYNVLEQYLNKSQYNAGDYIHSYFVNICDGDIRQVHYDLVIRNCSADEEDEYLKVRDKIHDITNVLFDQGNDAIKGAAYQIINTSYSQCIELTYNYIVNTENLSLSAVDMFSEIVNRSDKLIVSSHLQLDHFNLEYKLPEYISDHYIPLEVNINKLVGLYHRHRFWLKDTIILSNNITYNVNTLNYASHPGYITLSDSTMYKQSIDLDLIEYGNRWYLTVAQDPDQIYAPDEEDKRNYNIPPHTELLCIILAFLSSTFVFKILGLSTRILKLVYKISKGNFRTHQQNAETHGALRLHNYFLTSIDSKLIKHFKSNI